MGRSGAGQGSAGRIGEKGMTGGEWSWSGVVVRAVRLERGVLGGVSRGVSGGVSRGEGRVQD
jgi:hypothetical protein